MSVLKEQINSMSVLSTANLREALHAINRGQLGFALIIDSSQDRFLGLVTDGDIRRSLLKGVGLESPVSQVERGTPMVARMGTPPEVVAGLFSDRVRVVPLLDENDRVADLALLDRRTRLPVAEPSFGEKELQYVSECIISGWVSSAGKFVTQFERMFATFCGSRHAVATSSGTTALHLALVALGVGPGDEVIVPTLSFIATANAVTYTAARPIFVDSDATTWNIDPSAFEAAITSNTRAVVPVHLYGNPSRMDRILDIANKNKVAVIEDAAEAHGAKFGGRRVGGLGDMGVFSFYGNKIVTTGEGGMVVTNSDDMATKLRMLRDHGMSEKARYWHPVLGFNYRMTNMQAALGVAQMERIDDILESKRRVARLYRKGLEGIPGLILVQETPSSENVYWMICVLVEKDMFGLDREGLVKALTAVGIETRPIFPPIHLQPIYATGQKLSVATTLAEKGLSLPSGGTMHDSEISKVCAAIRAAQASA